MFIGNAMMIYSYELHFTWQWIMLLIFDKLILFLGQHFISGIELIEQHLIQQTDKLMMFKKHRFRSVRESFALAA
jgi:hypothetical protein